MMAHIEQRTDSKGNKRYRAQIRIKGQPTVSGTFNRKTDASRWVQETETEIRNGKYFHTQEAKKHTVNELIDRYEKMILPSLRSAKDRRNHFKLWKDIIGDLTLAEITPSKLVESRDLLTKGKTPNGTIRSSSTVNRYFASLSHAFSLAVKEWEWADDTPFRKISKLKEPRGRVRFLDDDERKCLLDACKVKSQPLYIIVVIALSTGARKGEILTLKWSQINLLRGTIVLHDTKNGERRSLPLQGYALKLVTELGKIRRLDTEYLFPSHSNPSKPLSIDTIWKQVVKDAKLKNFRFHDLRHTAASYLAMNGATLAEIAEILGHKTLQMVKRYSHLTEQHTAKVVARMNKNIF